MQQYSLAWPHTTHGERSTTSTLVEVAKYQRPDISGEAFNFSGYRIQGDDQSGSHWTSSHEVKFEVSFCNHSPITTTLKSIELDGTRLTPAVLFYSHLSVVPDVASV